MITEALIRRITALLLLPLLATAQATARETTQATARETAQATAEKRIYHTRPIASQPPEIDGKGDDAAWDEVEWSGDFTQSIPDDGGAPTQQTAFKILYDAHHIFVLIRAYDTEPERIANRVTRRDSFSADWVEINFDSFHDKRTSFTFTLTAAGSRGDEAVSNDGDDWDRSWDPVWQGVAGIDEEGWLAEMRIPLSQLRFSGEPGQIWGLQVRRQIYRLRERSDWQHIPQNSSGWVSQFGELRGLDGIKPVHGLEVLPYVMGGVIRNRSEEGNPFRDGQSIMHDIGLDGKVHLSGDLTLDVAVNPSFGQVEADPSRVNLTAFELFFEERRPLFVEGKNITLFNMGGGGPFRNDQLFYSRRIGRVPQRRPDLAEGQHVDMPPNTPILAAAKITGKTSGGLSIGIVDAVTAEAGATLDTDGVRSEEPVEPMTNFLIARLQQDFNDGASFVGSMLTATHRRNDAAHFGFLNRAAYTGGVDFNHQWNDRTYRLNGKLSFSHIQGTREAITRAQRASTRYFQRPDAAHVRFDSTRTALTGHGGSLEIARSGDSPWELSVGGTWRSPGLELNDAGFLRRADVFMQNARIGYRSDRPMGFFRRFGLRLNQWQGFNFGGDREFLGGDFNVNGEFSNHWRAEANLELEMGGLSASALRGGPSLRTPGGAGLSIEVDSDHRKPFSYGFGAGTNRSFESSGSTHSAEVSLQYRPSNTMLIRIDPSFEVGSRAFQYVATESFNGTGRYLLGRVDQKTLGIGVRLNYNVTPGLSIQYYGQPFVATGRYARFKRVADPRAALRGDRYVDLSDARIAFDDSEGIYRIDEDLDGRIDYAIENPDFTFLQFRSNLVLRWEYVPGSVLFLVWSQQRSGSGDAGVFSAGRNLNDLFDLHPENVYLAKISYWFSL